MELNIDEIHVVFENVEVIKVPFEDVSYIQLEGIKERLWENNILRKKNFQFELRKSAEYLHLIIENKEVYDRITKYNDITHIDFMNKGESMAYISIDWEEESNVNENVGQRVLVREHEIEVIVNAKNFDINDVELL